jgi:plastocyanin
MTHASADVSRRAFLRTAAGATAGAAATGTAAAQETTTTGDGGAETGGDGGATTSPETVVVGPDGNLVFRPGTDEALQITPGTTVEFVWESDNHNVVVESQPDDADWQGTPGAPDETYDTGYTYTHTFDVLGSYEYVCEPHRSAGMVGTVEVVESLAGGGEGTKELEELGVPIQAHWVGSATILGIIVSIVYTFYILKYGESPNTGNTGGEE